MKNKKALIAQISQNLAAEPVPPTVTSEREPTSPATRPPTKRQPGERLPPSLPPPVDVRNTGSGKQAAFWLDDEDRAIFHETGMLLYSQGIKPSHNLVLRAAIRMIPRDHRLVEKVRELMEKDGRKVRHQKSPTSQIY